MMNFVCCEVTRAYVVDIRISCYDMMMDTEMRIPFIQVFTTKLLCGCSLCAM